ncbi:hypothetical protein D6D19_09737 [Aureobasidium pullulans]|uniref:Uncharacterized protein n=1 Tax=Aureobasidium pullulans TaxID=5580 RepID=A0A4S8ZE43_AURPU|nr:hypothetical protein D6D28_09109 [Aureobasidium pullulans]THW62835.1 hypothetical protein D6D19_09737 [Aureobasidium pullulans]THY18488.1 hypothetical protein D6D00_08069 [Aureobasidium pullulans]THY82090.1 hypothetical protein D6C92_10149 [Aureobasidium pullulans]
MVAFQNIVISSILAVAATAAPTVLDKDVSSSTLVRRKNTNKCEAHIHIDTSNGLCGNSCTAKYNIDLLNNAVPAQAFGKTFDWSRVGTWSATNPNYQIKIATNRGAELWIDGRIPNGFVNDSWRSSFTLHYGNQHWNSHECGNWAYKSARASNGYRHEFDLWCEFDC